MERDINGLEWNISVGWSGYIRTTTAHRLSIPMPTSCDPLLSDSYSSKGEAQMRDTRDMCQSLVSRPHTKIKRTNHKLYEL